MPWLAISMSEPITSSAPAVLTVRKLVKRFPLRQDLAAMLRRERRFVHAVNGVDFDIAPGETLGLVGESGSGKSTIGKLIVRLIDPTEGEILIDGVPWSNLRGRSLRERRRVVQMIFQNPFLSLNPRWSVERILREPLDPHAVVPARDRGAAVAALLREVGLEPAFSRRYPHQFSGGQRQRIGIARALALRPKLLIADEPVSALDVSVQAQILNLLRGVQRKHGLSMLFISHDMSVVRHLCDRVAVMYLGRIVELAPRRELFAQPRHPYTRLLLGSILVPGQRRVIAPIQGEVPSPVNPPSGCAFHPRCPRAQACCAAELPPMRTLAPGHSAACHFPQDEPFKGNPR